MFSETVSSEYVILKNLLITLRRLNFDEGIIFLKNLLISNNELNFDSFLRGFIRYDVFDRSMNDDLILLNKELFDKSLNNIINGEDSRIHIPVNFYVKKWGSDYYSKIEYNNNTFLDVNDILAKFPNQHEKMQEQFNRIKLIISTCEDNYKWKANRLY